MLFGKSRVNAHLIIAAVLSGRHGLWPKTALQARAGCTVRAYYRNGSSGDAEAGRGEKTDVVYDLGCGDSRIVIAAAKSYGARGVGIDINPVRIGEAKENAKKAGVEKLVRFEENDLFDAKIGEASGRDPVPAA